MEQNGATGSAVSQAARTVLPDEPFDPPLPSQVPGPRENDQSDTAPVPHWNYESTPVAYGAPDHEPAMQYSAQPVTGGYPVDGAGGAGDVTALHEYASLPAARPYDTGPPMQQNSPDAYQKAVPDSTWPPAALLQPPGDAAPMPPMPPVLPQQYAPLQDSDPAAPVPPFVHLDEESTEGGHRRPTARSVDKRLLALVGAVAVAGGGYLVVNHFGSSNSSTAAAPVPVAAPAVVRYNFPANVAGLSLQRTPAVTTMRATELAAVKTTLPVLARTLSFASYSSGKPGIVAFTLRPPAGQSASAYATLMRQVATPAKGNVAVAYRSAVPGAAGGVMNCGGQRGANPYSYCVFKGARTIGAMRVTGSPKTAITEILTRELRAYAEH